MSVEDFMSSPRYDEIVDQLEQTNGGGTEPAENTEETAAEETTGGADVLALESIVLNGTAKNAADAITEAGQLLVAAGAVESAYVDAMHERERSISTYMGNGLAIPHGTNEARTPSDAPGCRSSVTPSRSTGTANQPSSSSESPVPARITWRCSPRSRECS